MEALSAHVSWSAVKVAVIIPARNEESRIGAVVTDALRALPGARILVVDDCSRDATAACARGAGADVLSLPRHAGYAGALHAGYREVLRDPVHAVLQMDGDGQHRASDLPRLVEALQGTDIVLGSRFLGPSPGYRIPATRRAGMAACRWMAAAVGGLDLTDPTSGLRAMAPAAAVRIATDGFPAGLTESSMLIHMHRVGFTIREIPVRMRASAGGSMHAGLAGGAHLLRIAWAVMGPAGRRSHPSEAPRPSPVEHTVPGNAL